MKQTCDEKMRIVAGRRGREQRATLHDVVSDERDQHRMFDVVVERVAVSDALKRQASDRWNDLGQLRLSRVKPAAQLGEQEIPQRLGCQLRNRQHESPSSWFEILAARE